MHTVQRLLSNYKMRLKRISGIYIIRNTVNGIFYVGKSVDIYKRWIKHKSELNRNIHYNPYLQNAWNKYGQSAFTFNIIEKCSLDKLEDCENSWIECTKCTSRNIGYNLLNAGEWLSKSSIKKSILIRQEKGIITKVHRYDLGGNYIDTWENCLKAGKGVGLPQTTVANSCRKGGRGGNYLWRRGEVLKKISPYLNKFPSIIKYEGSNEIKIFEGFEEAAQYFKVSTSSISQWIRKINKFPHEGELSYIKKSIKSYCK